MSRDPELDEHKEWLGYLQPVGLVLSALALREAGAHVDPNVAELQGLLRTLVTGVEDDRPVLPHLSDLLVQAFGWPADRLWGAPGSRELPEHLVVALPEFGEELRPTYAVPAPESNTVGMLISELPAGCGLDAEAEVGDRGWKASHQTRFERLLRDTGVAVGLLSDGTAIRLVHAPRGESPGHVTFPVAELLTVPGRPVLGALEMLLEAPRVFFMPERVRLFAILDQSRRYQNTVSTALSRQVLAALWALARGFHEADRDRDGALLGPYLPEHASQVYGGLLSTLMRLIFVLFAEDRGLLAADSPLYDAHYAVVGLYERLRHDDGVYRQAMHQRFGAWSRLLALFRLIHEGAVAPGLSIPAREGELFHPDRYPFLEGRGPYQLRGEDLAIPRISDAVVFEVLSHLLVLDGERLSYSALDVEQLGSVYEAMMGFELRRATGRSIAVGKADAPVVVDLDALLELSPSERLKHLDQHAGLKLSGTAEHEIKCAASFEALLAALSRRKSALTPEALPAGHLVLQPTAERRRTGTQYTPRSLTEPMVEHTLGPILERLGPRPTPEQILDLKVCDPAMGSGAFLVAACRYLADKLVVAWKAHGATPDVPPDEDPVLHARRLVAQRCLYGVDKNPFAVSLAKLSLWLATLAREHPFTFLDHALRQGDSLMGLTRQQLAAFSLNGKVARPLLLQRIEHEVEAAMSARQGIWADGDPPKHDHKRRCLRNAEDAVADLRLLGDLVIAAWFGAEGKKDREARRTQLLDAAQAWLSGGDRLPLEQAVETLRGGERPVTPFHWEVEFPEVFGRRNPGFDGMVGNPPFVGGKKISTHYGGDYLDLLLALTPGAAGTADLVAFFFRRAYALLRKEGTFGLIATNTIAQGDTRTAGLRWIREHDGTIYRAQKRYRWPGAAAVIVSQVHVCKGAMEGPYWLDERPVPRITAFLFASGGDADPARLAENADVCFEGWKIAGQGFTFDDADPAASPLALREELITRDSRNAERIFPYLGGEEVNDSPTHAHRRYVINFGTMTESEARAWPELMSIVEDRVKPERDRSNRDSHRANWWRYGETRPGLTRAIAPLSHVFVCSRVSKYLTFARIASGAIFSERLSVFALENLASFCCVQSRIHETWARTFSPTMKDDFNYSPGDAFETFPFPANCQSNSALEAAGQTYHDFRAALMIRNNEGLTKTYNRFHDPHEQSPDILELRRLHAAMDRAVLDAYGWTDLHPACDFHLEYEDDADDEPGKKKSDAKKPWRYRWSDDVRTEVLSRLMDLNAERAAEEARTRATATVPAAGKGRGKRDRKPAVAAFEAQTSFLELSP